MEIKKEPERGVSNVKKSTSPAAHLSKAMVKKRKRRKKKPHADSLRRHREHQNLEKVQRFQKENLIPAFVSAEKKNSWGREAFAIERRRQRKNQPPRILSNQE